QRTLVVRPRLLRHRQGDISAVGPAEETSDRWTLPFRAQPDIRGCRRICCWLELDRRVVAHGRVYGGARRWLSSARHILRRADLGTAVRGRVVPIPRKCESLVAKATSGSPMMKRIDSTHSLSPHHVAARDQPCMAKAPFM